MNQYKKHIQHILLFAALTITVIPLRTLYVWLAWNVLLHQILKPFGIIIVQLGFWQIVYCAMLLGIIAALLPYKAGEK